MATRSTRLFSVRLRGQWCALALAACATCRGAPADHPSPEWAGDGWYCLERHPPGDLASSCERAGYPCVERLFRNMPTQVCDSPEQTVCNRADHAFCFWLDLGQDRERRHVCMATLEDCESERQRYLRDPRWPHRWAVASVMDHCIEPEVDPTAPAAPPKPLVPFRQRMLEMARERHTDLAIHAVASQCRWWD